MVDMSGTMVCRCCGRDNALPGKAFAPDGLPVTPTVCGLCSRHQGSDAIDLKRAVTAHNEMWRTDLEEAKESFVDKLEERRTEMQAKIDSLQTELDERPIQVVDKYVDGDMLREAQDGAERAFRSRDRVLQDMTMLHLLHFEAASGKCRCGKAADTCEEQKILDGSKALKAWERRQSDARKRGYHHLLPQGHPGVVDARWDPDDPELAELYDDWGEPIF